MTSLTFKGTSISTQGRFPQVGDTMSDFKLVTADMTELSLSDVKGKKVVFNIFPSIDTPVCALQLTKFSQAMANEKDVVLLFAALDLPFAFKRFCSAEGIENAITASDFRYHSLDNMGVKMEGGAFAGLYARAVIVLDEHHQVTHSELVSEVTDEPDYDQAMSALNA